MKHLLILIFLFFINFSLKAQSYNKNLEPVLISKYKKYTIIEHYGKIDTTKTPPKYIILFKIKNKKKTYMALILLERRKKKKRP